MKLSEKIGLGFYRLWLSLVIGIAIFTFLSDLIGYNFYWLIPMPFSDFSIILHNYLITALGFGINNPISLALVTSFSCVFVIGGTLLAVALCFAWVKQGFVGN